MRNCSKFLRDDDGAIAIMAVWSMIAMTAFGALGVDLSSFYFQRRSLQSATDLAAIAAASNLGNARSAAVATLALNGFPASTLTGLQYGVYSADPATSAAERFAASDASKANAVEISTQIQSPFILAGVMALLSSSSTTCPTGQTCATTSASAGSSSTNSETIGARGIAASRPEASFAVGSGLLSLQGGVLNAVLGQMLGGNVSLSLMDYQSLASANINLFTFSNALATRASLTGVTYSQLAQGQFKVGDVLNAISIAAQANPNVNGVTSALSSLIAIAPKTTMSIAPIVDFGPYGDLLVGSASPIGASVSALDLLTAAAQIANGTHQIQAALNLNAPPIATANLALTIGERPVGQSFVTIGTVGASVHTAQTRLLLTLQIGVTGSNTLVNLPLYLEIASATATLGAVSCPTTSDGMSATLNVMPSLVNAWIGNVSNSDMTNYTAEPVPSAATLLSVPGVATVSGRANVSLTNLTTTPAVFSALDIQNLIRKSTSTQDPIASLLSNLFGDLQLSTQTLGLNLSLPALPNQVVAQTLATATTPIDQTVASVLDTLGLSLGNAYTWVSGVSCGRAVLVN